MSDYQYDHFVRIMVVLGIANMVITSMWGAVYFLKITVDNSKR